MLLVSTYELGRQPFGLASAAGALARAGAAVTCVDTGAGQELRDEPIASSFLVAFYVPMHAATRLAVPLAERVMRANPSAHLCFFGLYAAMNEPFLRRIGARTILSGEFEAGLVSLYQGLAAAEPTLPPLASISLARQSFAKPDRSGLPDLSKYARLRVADDQEWLVGHTEASRGCKHRCRHCPVVPIYDGKFRVVDREVVLADIDQQVQAGARHITFGDPDFWNGPAHARAIVRELHRRHPDVGYDVTIKVEHLLKNQGDLPLLRDTGCVFVTSALESVDDEILAFLEKGHVRADFLRVVELFREVGLTLAPTFVAFTPWTTLDGYLDLLETIAEIDLVEHTAAVQLAIRLLIPAGSRLLELPSVRSLVSSFDESALSYPWAHPDARVDRLQAEVLDLVKRAGTATRRTIFAGVLRLARAAAGSGAPAIRPRPARRGFVPYLTEPWYC